MPPPGYPLYLLGGCWRAAQKDAAAIPNAWALESVLGCDYGWVWSEVFDFAMGVTESATPTKKVVENLAL
ncbi:hypothetical protein [Flavobacterium sp.]|uniref:hypothetical protein n=1 Tax=Flavobacterium sp. TaxID=239 RepID=UPI0011F4EEE2|nr:hypothetical protein [Flavobacterium sp.]RZJ72165.1 MAG: hypothetical protein EOO49_06850 [Flavobacterium sp.]